MLNFSASGSVYTYFFYKSLPVFFLGHVTYDTERFPAIWRHFMYSFVNILLLPAADYYTGAIFCKPFGYRQPDPMYVFSSPHILYQLI